MARTKDKIVAVKEKQGSLEEFISVPPNKADKAVSLEPSIVTTENQNSGIQLLSEQSEIQSGTESQVNQLEIMHLNSLDARWLLEHRSVLRELHRALVRHIIFYTKPEGGGLSMEEAISKATEVMEGPEAEDYYKHITTMSVKSISWLSIDRLFRYSPEAAQALWEDLKEQADKDFKSGHFAAQVLESAELQQDPWTRAKFIAVRDSFVEQFKPQGGIDYSMIDMLAMSFTFWMHWTQVHNERATTDPTKLLTDVERLYVDKREGNWMPPRVSERDAIEHAAQMADRWRRAYQATLRHMRDWRRYNVPVTINNPQQVNIAADGGQQVNAVKVEE
jgi:hypothetical protein